MSVPKQYERSMLNAFKNLMPDGYVERNTDRVYGNGLSAPSPPDFLAINGESSYLVECKAVKGISIPLNRLSPHQEEYLTKFHRMPNSFAYVAVLFYNGGRGKSQVKRSFLVPVGYWSSYPSKYGRKSLALKHVENDIPYLECKWESGGWTLPTILTDGLSEFAVRVVGVDGHVLESHRTASNATRSRSSTHFISQLKKEKK